MSFAMPQRCAEQRISEAVTALIFDQIFFGALAYRLTVRIVEDSNICETAMTNGREIVFLRSHVDSLPNDELQTLIAHEVMHCAYLHHTRRGGRDAERWNDAGDYAINSILKDAKFTLGDDYLYDAKYDGLSAEQIYDQLTPPPPPKSGNDGQQPPQQQQGSAAPQNQPPPPSAQPGQGGSAPAPAPDQGATPAPAPKRPPGQVLDAPKPSEDAVEWQLAVANAMKTARAMGQMPGDAARIIEQALKSKNDWMSELSQFAEQTAKNDFSWSRPNTRYAHLGIVLPGLRSDEVPGIDIVIDTSGSVDERTLGLFTDAVNAIADQVKPRYIRVLNCDTRVHASATFYPGDEITLTALGGGGTKFWPAFDWIEASGDLPACVLYLTDGEGAYGDEREYPVMWCMISDVVPPWGQRVQLEEYA